MHTLISTYPLVRIALVVGSGILMAAQTSLCPVYYMQGALACLFMVLMSLRQSLQTSWRFIVGVPTLATIALLGAYLYALQNPRYQDTHFSKYWTAESYLKVRLLSLQHRQAVLSVEQVDSTPCKGKVLVYVDEHLRVGEHEIYDYFIARVSLRNLRPSINPSGFDRVAYYNTKEVYHEGNIFVWDKLPTERKYSLQKYLFQLRGRAKSILRKGLSDEIQFAIASALLLGDKTELNTDIKSAFADTGSMHVLAVSGMHLGVLYMILLFISSSVSRRWNWIKIPGIIFFLWMFAFFVGGAASVKRAALMFSLLLLGKLLTRKSATLNSIAGAAIFLLITDPNSLFDVGFQLSFSAIVGIVLLQRPIERIWWIRNRLGRQIWKLVTVSIAAQLFTLPFALYYFHLFPVYFWLSGIIVVPLATIILSSGLFLLAFHSVPILGIILTKILSFVLWFLQWAVFSIQQLPGVRLKGVWLDSVELCLLTMLIVLATWYILSRHPRVVIASVSLILILQVYGFSTSVLKTRAGVFICYFISGHSGADLIFGRTVYPIGVVNDDTYLRRYQDFRASHGINTIESNSASLNVIERSEYIVAGDFQVFRPQNEVNHLVEGLDVVWIMDASIVDKWNIPAEGVEQPIILLDGSLSYREARDATDKFVSMGYVVHNVRVQGAFIEKIKIN